MQENNYAHYLATDLSEYIGQWVAIVDEKIVAHGENAKQVYEHAKKEFPHKIPFLACVPKAIAMIL